MKRVFLSIVVCVCASFLSAQSNPLFVTQEVDYVIRDSIDSNGNKYIGYAGQLPSLITFVNNDGTINICTSDAKTKETFVYEYTKGMTLTKTSRFQNELPTLGAFMRDADGNYYFFYAASGSTTENMAMVKYDKHGNKAKTYKLAAHAPNSLDGVKTPFDAGACRIELSGSLLAVYFARLMFNGHQASYGFVLDKDTFERVDNGAATNNREQPRRIMPYVSHSFNQWIFPVENGFIFADHGDAYPRAFAFAKFQTNNRTKRLNAFPFSGSAGENATYAQMGGMAKTTSGFLFAGAYGRTAANPRNLFIMTLEADLSGYSAPVYLTSYTKEEGHAAHPKITALDKNRYLLLWELCTFSTQSANAVVADTTGYKATYMLIIDETGKPLSETRKLPDGIRLNMNDVLRYNKETGNVYWAVNIGGKTFGVWGFNPDKETNYVFDASIYDTPVLADKEYFKYSVKGKKGEAQTITITKYTGPINNLIIPDEIDGIPVTVIAKNAFTRSTITSVEFPKTLKVIEDTAFWYSGITSLTIPDSVESIGKQAFSFCNGLVSVAVSKNLKTIKEFAFMSCQNLTTVTIPDDSDLQLGYGAFDKCPKLDAESLRVISSF